MIAIRNNQCQYSQLKQRKMLDTKQKQHVLNITKSENATMRVVA